MKKLKTRLENRIIDLLSPIVLYCEGKGNFIISNTYRFPISEKFYLEINKRGPIEFTYQILLTSGHDILLYAIITYDIFGEKIPIYKAYSISKLQILAEIDNIVGLKALFEQLKNEMARRG